MKTIHIYTGVSETLSIYNSGSQMGVHVPLGVLQGVRERYHFIIIIRYPYHFTEF